MMDSRVNPRILLAKSSLDGHWRGLNVVSRALRDAGFEVIVIGMATSAEIVGAALEEDVDLVGLNVGGRVEAVERIVGELRAAGCDAPIFAGGTIAPSAAKRLNHLGVETYPPGSALGDIVAAARRLTEPAP